MAALFTVEKPPTESQHTNPATDTPIHGPKLNVPEAIWFHSAAKANARPKSSKRPMSIQ